jgi:hypothetical protein
LCKENPSLCKEYEKERLKKQYDNETMNSIFGPLKEKK